MADKGKRKGTPRLGRMVALQRVSKGLSMDNASVSPVLRGEISWL